MDYVNKQLNIRFLMNINFRRLFTTVDKMLWRRCNLLAVMSGINIVCGNDNICLSWRCDPQLQETIGCILMNGLIRPLLSHFFFFPNMRRVITAKQINPRCLAYSNKRSTIPVQPFIDVLVWLWRRVCERIVNQDNNNGFGSRTLPTAHALVQLWRSKSLLVYYPCFV